MYHVQMDCTTELESELDLYFAWLTQFEAGIPTACDVASRWYTSAVLQSYTRYSWFKPSSPGEPAICLVNITVAEAMRDQGFFARLVDRFAQGRDGLQARVLYLENLANPGFENWLQRRGFRHCPFGGSTFSSCYLARR